MPPHHKPTIENNPFKPGAGLPPPHLVGRSDEKGKLEAEFSAMKSSGIGNTILMYGPRGMGKTVLLGWLEGECGGWGIDTASFSAKNVLGSIDGLGERLLSGPARSGGHDVRTEFSGSVNIPGDIAKVSASVKTAPKPDAGRHIPLSDQFIEQASKKPLAILLDEAHSPPDTVVLMALLEAAQIASRCSPFLLLLTGAPELVNTLQETQSAATSLTERNKRIGVGLIKNSDEAAEAIRKPMEDNGITVGAEALACIVEDSQGYPYFLQEWGKRLWDYAVKSKKWAINQSDVTEVGETVQARKNILYNDRYRSIERNDELLIAANAVAGIFTDQNASHSRDSVHHAIESALSPKTSDGGDRRQRARQLLDELNGMDFVWQSPESVMMEVGTPSFMTYIQKHSGGQFHTAAL